MAGLAAALLSACTTMGTEVTPQQLSGLKKGETTVDEAITQLGPPTSSTVSSNGQRVISYFHVSAQARPATFIPIVGALVGGADSKSTTTTLVFGPDGKLQEYHASQSQVSTGMGFASGGPSPATVEQNGSK